MGIIDNIALGFSVQTSALSKGLAKAKDDLNSFGSSITSVQGLFLGLAGALGVGLSVDAFASMVKGGLDAIDVLNDTAIRLNATTQALSALNFAAKLDGSSAEDLAKALTKMQVNLGKADGDKNPFSAIGLSLDELKGKDPTAQFTTIAEALSQIDDPAQRAAQAQAIFGKGASSVMQLIMEGKGGIEEMTAEFEALGLGISSLDASKAAETNDALDKIGMVIQGLKNKLASELAPFITAIANKFLDWAKSGQNMGVTVTSAVEMVAKGIAFAADIVDVFKLGWDLAQAGITKAIAVIVRAIAAMSSGIEAFINLLPGVKVNFTSTMNAIADDLDKLAGNQFKKFQDDLVAPSSGDKVTKMFDSIKNSAGDATNGIKNFGEAATEGMNDATKSAEKLIDKLTLQIATFGMSSAEAEIFKLQQEGASDATIGQAQGLADQLKGLEDNKKAQADLAKANEKIMNEGEKIFESTRTPIEKYEKTIADLNQLLSVGAIDQDTFNRASDKAATDLKGTGDKTVETKFASAATFGSAAARTAILQNQTGGKDPMTDIKNINAEQLVVQKTANDLLTKLVTNGGGVDVIDDF